MLCMFLAFWGCNSDQALSKLNEEKLESASDVIASGDKRPEWLFTPDVIASENESPAWIEGLPEWLYEWVERNCEEFTKHSWSKGIDVEVFRGEWNDKTVYHLYTSYHSSFFNPIYEKGGRIDVKYDDFISSSKNWVLIFQIEKGIVTVDKVRPKT